MNTLEDKLIFLFSHLIQLRQDEISFINEELTSLYFNSATLPALFSLFHLKICKEIRILASCGIKTTLKNVFNSLTDLDIREMKQRFITLFRSETDFEALNIIIEASSILFPQWPEILDFLQTLVEISTEESYQLAMTILSKIPENLYNQSLDKYIEICSSLIIESFNEQTNCRAALELFSSISHFTPISDRLHDSFPDFFLKFLLLFQEYLISNNSDSFQIAVQLEKSIKSIEIDNPSVLLNLLIELANNENIKDRNKIAIFNVINSILKKEIVPDLFESILQIGIKCSSSLFDNYCYIENEALQISFQFLEYFTVIEGFEDIIIRNLQTTSPGLIFATLSALFHVLPYISSSKLNIFISYALSSCEMKIHSISELAFSIVYNTDYDFVCEEMISNIVLVTLNNCALASDHLELQSIILQLIIKLLFNRLIQNEVSEILFSMLCALFNQEQSIFVRDKIILCFAGFVECFDKESVFPKLALFMPLLIECSKAFNPQCVLCQAAAIESISVCISNFSEYFFELINPYTTLLLSWIEDTQDRQHIDSSIYSFQRLILSGNLSDVNILSIILNVILNYVNVSENAPYIYTGIDDSGISFADIQNSCLTFIRKFMKFFFLNKNASIENNFLMPLMPSIISTLCRYVVLHSDNNEYGMKTIFLICKCLYNIQPVAIVSFGEFFLSLFESNFDLSSTFFQNLLNLDIYTALPDIFFRTIYDKLLQKFQEGDNKCILLFEKMSSKFATFPIDQFIGITKNKSDQLSGSDFSGIVSVFCNYMIHNAISQDNFLSINDIMSISFNSLHFCTDFSIKPSPIRLLSLLINFSIEFNDQTISQFYPFFIEIFKNSKNPKLKSKYTNETILESILFLLKVVVTLPEVKFPYEIFLCQIFSFLPLMEYFSSNSDILNYLCKLPSIPHFSKLSPYFDDLFACLIRIISLDESSIYEIGIENNSFSAVLKFAFEMLRAKESRTKIIIDTAAGDKEKLIKIQSKINEIARNPEFLRIC